MLPAYNLHVWHEMSNFLYIIAIDGSGIVMGVYMFVFITILIRYLLLHLVFSVVLLHLFYEFCMLFNE